MGMIDVMLRRGYNYAHKFSGTVEVLIESLKGTVWNKDNYIGSRQQSKYGGLEETQFGKHNEDLKNKATDYIIELSHKLDELKELGQLVAKEESKDEYGRHLYHWKSREINQKKLLDAISDLKPYYDRFSSEEEYDWAWGTWDTWNKDNQDKFFRFTRK